MKEEKEEINKKIDRAEENCSRSCRRQVKKKEREIEKEGRSRATVSEYRRWERGKGGSKSQIIPLRVGEGFDVSGVVVVVA